MSLSFALSPAVFLDRSCTYVRTRFVFHYYATNVVVANDEQHLSTSTLINGDAVSIAWPATSNLI
jgi:hypothetical protein